MAIRIATLGVPLFQHDGLVVNESWTPFDPDTAAAAARKAFVTYVGRFVQVHPADVAALEQHNMRLEGGRIVDAAAQPKKGPAKG